MSEEDYKSVLAIYQQKSFELFNSNVMMETQIIQLKKQIQELQKQVHDNYLKGNDNNVVPENGSDDF